MHVVGSTNSGSLGQNHVSDNTRHPRYASLIALGLTALTGFEHASHHALHAICLMRELSMRAAMRCLEALPGKKGGSILV